MHDTAKRLSGIVTFTLPNVTSEAAHERLRQLGFELSVSDHRYAAVDLSARRLTSVLRASPHHYNTDDEIEQLLEAYQYVYRSPE